MAATPVSSVKESHADYYRRCADDVIRTGGIYIFSNRKKYYFSNSNVFFVFFSKCYLDFKSMLFC